MKILMLDNYDSFTFNLVQLVKENSNHSIDVHRNDEITLQEVVAFDKIILSPGPGIPSEAGILLELIQEFKGKKPILGVCLGMQAIGQSYGGNLVNLGEPLHGISTPIEHTSKLLLKGIESPFAVGRYHSWAIESENLHPKITITAKDKDGVVMAIEDESNQIFGVQFHPESILTDFGAKIITNFLNFEKA